MAVLMNISSRLPLGLGQGLDHEPKLEGHPLREGAIWELVDSLTSHPKSPTQSGLVLLEVLECLGFGDADGLVHGDSQPQLSS